MINPPTLWGLLKSCDNSEWLGDICRALGGQDVKLDFSQQQIVNAIKNDSGWTDEITEEKREKWRDKQKLYRSRRCEAPETTVDNGRQMETLVDIGRQMETSQVKKKTETKKRTSPPAPPYREKEKKKEKGGGGGSAHTRTHTRESESIKTEQSSYPTEWAQVEDYLESIDLMMFDPNGVKAVFLKLAQYGWTDSAKKPIEDWKEYIKNVVLRLNVPK